MSDGLLLLLLLVLLACLLLTVAGLLLHSGLLAEVDVKTGPPPIRNVTIAYKFKEGAYKDSGAAFTETCSIGPKLSTIALFYDDPKERPPEKCRYAVGSVLSEGEEQPDEEMQKLYEKFGFKVFSLPEVSHAVTTTFPSAPPLSTVLGPLRVYPRLDAYIKERKLCAFPLMEICGPDLINYMAPLSRQSDFLVPEMVEEAAPIDTKEEDSDEDRGTDITGADSHSDVSSVSGSGGGAAAWDSRETSLAASTAASLASSLPLRDVADAEAHHDKLRERSDRGSDQSVGSGSSFEELDMDQEVEPEVEVEPEEAEPEEVGVEPEEEEEEEEEMKPPPPDGAGAGDHLPGRPREGEE